MTYHALSELGAARARLELKNLGGPPTRNGVVQVRSQRPNAGPNLIFCCLVVGGIGLFAGSPAEVASSHSKIWSNLVATCVVSRFKSKN